MTSLRSKLVSIFVLLVSCAFISSATASDTTYYYNDALGSPVAAANQDGDILWRAEYYPYGYHEITPVAPDGGTQAAENSRWYTGHAADNSTGLVYAGARFYDPVIGRFYGVDAVGFSAANTMSFNRYGYAYGSPYNYTDPDGNIPVDTVWDVVSVVYDAGKITYGAVTSNPALVAEGMTDLVADLAATAVPYVPAGSTKIARIFKKAGDSVDSSDVVKGARILSTSQQKSIRNLEKRLKEHQQKLDDYKRNPDAFDNKGFLKNAPNEQRRQKIIEGRVRHLEKEMQTFQKDIDGILNGGGRD